MSLTEDINQDGVIDENDDLNQDGITDIEDARIYAEQSAKGGPTDENAATKYVERYGVTQDYVPPIRELRRSATKPDTGVLYEGPSLLDPRGFQRGTDIAGNPLPPGVYQGLYDVKIDSVKLLQELDFDKRKELTDFLYAKGLYQGSKPSPTRFDDKDFDAVGRLLNISNQTARTYDVTIGWIANNLKTVYGGAKVGAVTPIENREKVLDTEAVEILGRKLTQAEIREAAEMIARRERSGDKTNLSVMAEKAVSAANPKLEAANRFAKGVDIFRSMLGTG